ncbi:MAG: hypothetical protein HY761_10830 [Candidatus Omnitrophica bacterium]|nr:hypothetical protein [Candidatus Omnitrophota bacterium]
MKKILIVYASAGAGHFKAAEAVYKYLKNNEKDAQIEFLDILQQTNFLFRLFYTWGYSFLINHAVALWRWAFWATYVRRLRRLTKKTAVIIDRLNSARFSDYLVRQNPDFIISTHFLPSEIAAYLKTQQKITSKVITIITDFGVHPYWLSLGTDIYIVASDYTKEKLLLESGKPEDIRASGIPVDEKFLKSFNRRELSLKLGLDADKFTGILITGSFGLGPIEEIVDALHGQLQLIVVCARNKKLFTRLKKKNYPDCLVLGFVDNVQELMAVSDIIITKPGGMTISEVLAMELVPFFISPIPGQETENMKALQNYGIGQEIKRASDFKEIIFDCKNNPGKMQKVREAIKKIKKPNAAQELSRVIR